MSVIKNCIQTNVCLHDSRLVVGSFGNASQRIDDNHFVIKPSGVDPSMVDEADMPVIEICSGKQVKGKMRPSTDTPTHGVLYKRFTEIGGIVHCHSLHASAWAQAGMHIPMLGTSHADYWHCDIPVTRALTSAEISESYEHSTGVSIAGTIENLGCNALFCPGVLVRNHGPFTWGIDAAEALQHAQLLEYVAELASLTISLNQGAEIDADLAKKHYDRKHGENAYYGQ